MQFVTRIWIYFVLIHSAQAQIPDLTQYSDVEKRSIESACSSDRYKGPAAYARCLGNQISQYASVNKIPDLTQYSDVEKRSIESACSLSLIHISEPTRPY